MTEPEYDAREARIMNSTAPDWLVGIAISLVLANALVWAAILS